MAANFDQWWTSLLIGQRSSISETPASAPPDCLSAVGLFVKTTRWLNAFGSSFVIEGRQLVDHLRIASRVFKVRSNHSEACNDAYAIGHPCIGVRLYGVEGYCGGKDFTYYSATLFLSQVVSQLDKNQIKTFLRNFHIIKLSSSSTL